MPKKLKKFNKKNIRVRDDDISVPLNFIPGTTKPIVKKSPVSKRKEFPQELCCQGVHIAVHKNESLNHRALLSAGLKSLVIPAPSHHVDDMEHTVHLGTLKSGTKSETALHQDRIDLQWDKEGILPEKIIRKGIGSKKWKSLDRIHLKKM